MKTFTLAEVAAMTGISLTFIRQGCRANPPTIEHTVRGGGQQRRHRVMTQAQVDKLVGSRTVGSSSASTEPEPVDDLTAVLLATQQRLARRSRGRAA